MDWNLDPNKQTKMADRVLDLLDQWREGRPISRSVARSHAVDLHEELQVRKCVNNQSAKPARNQAGSPYKPMNPGRNKWFDAK